MPQETEIPVLASHMGNNETVMIIDDVAEQIEIATVILKKLGYRAVSASSGEEAITYLKSASVDILILDMVMEPGMDGLDTYKKILEIHPGQKAVIVSGYAENNRVKQLQRLGATHYVKKPYTIDKIGKALKEALEK
ncbi:putative Sporulation initiation phosphotransferase F [Desulfamplus magnetovallimortis]|uniref:Putative Sporulation initiation phosphotransferase F n=2 Tax=Desulfamplus magnetovallimortis TaxID=1246637 RepID=A0A1W1HCH5_9BACT|nr:putative Sporulation initiation phosphotransferase F [Desulfamplus magnetovallimortis]